MLREFWHAIERRVTDWQVRRALKPQPIEPDAIRFKGQHVTKEVFDAVKHSLKLVGRARGYETVKHVADMHGIGRTTAYKIKASPTFGHFLGTAKNVPVVSKDRPSRVKVTAK